MMKTVISIIVILGLGGLGIALTSKSPATIEVVVLQDITDTTLILPNTDEILSFYSLSEKWNGAIFHFTDITDVSFNKKTEVKLNGENEWLSNELDRDKEIEKFKTDVTDVITEAGKAEAGKSHSSIYLPIVRELNQLSNSKVQRKVIIIYSDLMENTTDISFYRPQDILLLTTSPERIQARLEKQLTLNSLSGIEVYFIYQPLNDETDQNFQLISKFYKNLLEAKGAKVNIGANINL